TTGNINDSVVQIHSIEHLALHGQQLLVLLFRILRLAVGKHFHLVELVHAQDTAGVLAVGTSFTTEARRPARVLNWTIGKVDDFIFVVARKCHLRGTNKVQVIAFYVVDFIRVVTQETSTSHDLWTYQHWWNHQSESSSAGLLRSEKHHAQLQESTITGEVVKTRATDFRTALGVNKS